MQRATRTIKSEPPPTGAQHSFLRCPFVDMHPERCAKELGSARHSFIRCPFVDRGSRVQRATCTIKSEPPPTGAHAIRFFVVHSLTCIMNDAQRGMGAHDIRLFVAHSLTEAAACNVQRAPSKANRQQRARNIRFFVAHSLTCLMNDAQRGMGAHDIRFFVAHSLTEAAACNVQRAPSKANRHQRAHTPFVYSLPIR